MKVRLFCFIIVLCSLFFVPPAFAQETVKQFDTTMTAKKDGSMQVVERIVYDFGTENRHGIYRYIPLVSKVGDLYRVITVDFQEIQRDGEDEDYEVETTSERKEVKIGDPDRTITGEHTYTISYLVKNGVGSNYEDHDEIYWNVTGNGWEVPIASASVLLKTDFGVPVGETICFTGQSGATEKDCIVEKTGTGVQVVTTSPLESQEGLTFVSSFSVNTFPKSTLQKDKPMDPDFKLFLFIAIPILILLNFILAPFLLFWYFTKKHKKRFGKPVVTFDLPKDKNGERITPAEAGTIDTTKLDKDDITATIFDLAIRKYLKIEGIEKKGKVLGIGTKQDYKLIQLKDFSDLTEFEKKLMEALFDNKKEVLMSEATVSYTDFKALEKANFVSLINRGFYTKNPATQMGTLLGVGIAALATWNFVLGPVLIFLSRMLNGRTALGDKTDFKIDGLKIFLKATNRYNAWQAKNILTLEQMIPFAMSLGYIDQFMKQLKILKPDYQPNWYSGRGTFYGSYAGFTSSMNSGITTTAPSSSSGFSGGSSGGGGGGGGGGSW